MNENGEILPENIKMAKTFNSYFELITDSLQLFDWTSQLNTSDDKVQDVVKNFSNHPSIIKIKQKLKSKKKFSFQCVSEATVSKFVKNMLLDKATAGEIPVNVTELKIITGEKQPRMKYLFNQSVLDFVLKMC